RLDRDFVEDCVPFRSRSERARWVGGTKQAYACPLTVPLIQGVGGNPGARRVTSCTELLTLDERLDLREAAHERPPTNARRCSIGNVAATDSGDHGTLTPTRAAAYAASLIAAWRDSETRLSSCSV